MTSKRSLQVLCDLFKSQTVVDLPAIQQALGGVSQMTAFRYLRQIAYRRSYNHNGRFYCLHELSRYDRLGLWSWRGIHFSRDGSLRSTARRLVCEAEAGATHRELQEHLHVRVQNTLADLLRSDEIGRDRLLQVFVYVHIDGKVREEQLSRRRDLIDAGQLVELYHEAEVSDTVVIQILLTLIRHPGSLPVEVVRYLRGYSPPIKLRHVDAVFTRYDLGKKGGNSTS